VTTGDIWQFGSFHRLHQVVTPDLMLYRVPTDLEVLMQYFSADFDTSWNLRVLDGDRAKAHATLTQVFRSRFG
jgi:hypothetical protein